MKLTTPKQLFTGSMTYYVSSESGGPDHIVVQVGGTFYCDCRDFFVRHLPLLGTPAFSLCKHGEFARENAPKVNPPKKFGVFAVGNFSTFRSTDVPGEYNTYEEAQTAIDKSGDRYVKYDVREL